MAIDPTVKRDIVRSSLRYHIDPRAAQAIANVEGGLVRGRIGDHGTSGGPFQLHIGGALPRGRSLAWASTPAGIDYSIRKMAESGAAGLTGRGAVTAISRRFERPADPSSEIRRAMAFYGGSAGALNKAAPNVAGSSAFFGQGARSDLAQYLQSSLMTYAQTGEMPMNPMDLLNVSRVPTDPGPPGVPTASSAHAPTFGGTMGSGTGKEQSLIESMRHAKSMGMRISENTLYDKVDPVHVKGSFHYQYYPGMYQGKRVNRAADVSGTPQQMSQFDKWVAKKYGKTASEIFYDPLGGIKYGKQIGAIGGHRDHVHIAF